MSFIMLASHNSSPAKLLAVMTASSHNSAVGKLLVIIAWTLHTWSKSWSDRKIVHHALLLLANKVLKANLGVIVKQSYETQS